MSDASNVDSDKLLAAAGQMEGIVDRMNRQVMKFTEAIEALDKGWVSDVKSGFMSTYRTDLDAMQEMISQLTELNALLRESAADFDKTENEAVASVGSLR